MDCKLPRISESLQAIGDVFEIHAAHRAAISLVEFVFVRVHFPKSLLFVVPEVFFLKLSKWDYEFGLSMEVVETRMTIKTLCC